MITCLILELDIARKGKKHGYAKFEFLRIYFKNDQKKSKRKGSFGHFSRLRNFWDRKTSKFI